MRDEFSRTVPTADTPQDGVVLQALDQVASGGEIVNGFSYESAGDGEAILSRTAIPSCAAGTKRCSGSMARVAINCRAVSPISPISNSIAGNRPACNK